MFDWIKSLFKETKAEMSHNRMYVKCHGLNLRCLHCDTWQADVLELHQEMDLEFNYPRAGFDTLTCAVCNKDTTFFDTGCMGVRIAVDTEQARLGNLVQLDDKPQPQTS